MLDLTGILGVIFDLDGTLVESSLNFQVIRKAIGCPPNNDLLIFLDKLPDAEKQRAKAIIIEHELADAQRAKLLPKGKRMLEQVNDAGLPTAIVTRNCRAATTMKLANNAIGITNVITREDMPAKPNPTALLHLAKQWAIHPSDLIYIGDDVYDKQAAENAGMQWLLV